MYTHPVLRKLSEFMINRKDYEFTNFSIDNNIYRTKLLKKFKIHIYSGYLDTANFLRKNGFKWVSDIKVVSEHIRPSLRYFLLHDYMMHNLVLSVSQKKELLAKMFKLFITSPFRALQVSFKKKCPQIMVVYPVDRFLILMTCLKINH